MLDVVYLWDSGCNKIKWRFNKISIPSPVLGFGIYFIEESFLRHFCSGFTKIVFRTATRQKIETLDPVQLDEITADCVVFLKSLINKWDGQAIRFHLWPIKFANFNFHLQSYISHSILFSEWMSVKFKVENSDVPGALLSHPSWRVLWWLSCILPLYRSVSP